MSAAQQRPPWLIPAVAMGIFTLLFVGGLFLLGNYVRGLQQDNSDPEKRRATAEAILGAPLPQDWHALAAYRLPGDFSQLLILSDLPAEPGIPPAFHLQGVWINKTLGRGYGGTNAYLDQDDLDTGGSRGAGFVVSEVKRLSEGTFMADKVEISYTALHGSLQFLDFSGEAITHKFAWGCEQEGVVTLGMWFHSTEGAALPQLDKLQSLVAALHPCATANSATDAAAL